MNTCDRCDEKIDSADLVWLTAEDFEPRPGERVPKSAYKQYDALCDPCYMQVIE